jgi:hypothetical protein
MGGGRNTSVLSLMVTYGEGQKKGDLRDSREHRTERPSNGDTLTGWRISCSRREGGYSQEGNDANLTWAGEGGRE